MKTGGITQKTHAMTIMKVAGLITPLIFIAYGILALLDRVPTLPLFNEPLLITTSSVWLVAAFWQFLWPPRSYNLVRLRLGLYYICAAIFLLTVTGVASPLAVCWIFLIITGSLYFGTAGVYYGIISFIVVVGLDIVLGSRYGTDMQLVLFDLGALIAVLLSGIVVISITKSQTVDQNELEQTKQRASLQTNRILTLVNNLADAVLSTDSDGIVQVYNAASLNLLDTNDSLIGHHIDEVVPLKTVEGKEVILSQLFKKARTVRTRDDVLYSFADGETLRLDLTISPIRTSFQSNTVAKNDGYIVIMRDVTKEKSLEEERDEFISVVSHELRTPTTIVEGTLSNLSLMMERDKVDKSLFRANLATAHDQVMLLARMINDLSTLSRAERGVADDTETIDVDALAHALYTSYSDEAEAKGLHFNLDISPQLGTVQVSRLYLEELLQNFITNAIKYTHEGAVTLKITKKTNGTLEFAVKDTGIGISKRDQAKVFDKFYRSEDFRTRETGGTGLGLYVCVKLAKKLGTSLHLTSRLNHGSTFSFSLPRVSKK